MPFGQLGGWTAIIILVVVLLLFGAPKLPALSKSIADSLKIFRKEMKPDSTEPDNTEPDSAKGNKSTESDTDEDDSPQKS